MATTAALAPSVVAGPSTKRLSTIAKPSNAKGGNGGGGPERGVTSPINKAKGSGGLGGVKDVVSPGELCGFVDTLINQIETRFDEMSEQALARMDEMSSRIDSLENAIQDLMQNGIEAGAAGEKSAPR